MKMNGFPSGEARHLVGIRENGDDAWHHLSHLVLHLVIYQGFLCIQEVVFCWISIHQVSFLTIPRPERS